MGTDAGINQRGTAEYADNATLRRKYHSKDRHLALPESIVSPYQGIHGRGFISGGRGGDSGAGAGGHAGRFHFVDGHVDLGLHSIHRM